MLFAWAVPAALWLLVHFTAEACSPAHVPAGHPPHHAETCARGTMTADTTAHVQPGTNVTLSCQMSHPQHGRIAIFFNDSELISNNSHSVSTRFPVRAYGRFTFTCKIVWEHKKKLICGIIINSGNPPDEPRNVSCVQEGTDGHPTCSWEKGRFTYIPTSYVLRLSNGTDVICVSEESLNEKFGSLTLSKLDFDSNYTVVVIASNELGSALSQQLRFMLVDIVKPRPPDFLVECGNSSSTTSCTFSWHAEAPAQLCRLRYRPLTRDTWSRVENLTSETCNLHGLEPHTTYKFQVSCKIHPERGLWSDWQTYQTQTPEAEPTGRLDVWYHQQDLDSQRQNISLFWKALRKSEARGQILGYTVTFEALSQQSPPAETHLATQTSYTRVMPRVDYKITVTAENSRGRSPPTSITTNLGTQELPPPQKVSVVAVGSSSILVSWGPPAHPPAPIGGYVVEWAHGAEDLCPPAWVKVPAPNLSTLIAEHLKDNLCYQVRVFALYWDRAGQAVSARGNSRAKAPSAGPQMHITPQANGILVSWEEIPAHQQRGCIVGYHIYLQKRGQEEAPTTYAVPGAPAQHSLYITHLQPGQLYTLWMTASTTAGEGPSGNSETICLESAAVDWVAVVLTCSFLILSACLCSVPPVRKALRPLLSALVPRWPSQPIPDPANAAWVKSCLSVKAELSWPSNPFLHSSSTFEEPQPTPVEEAFVKTDLLVLKDQLLLGSSGRRDWLGPEELVYPALPGPALGQGDEQQLPQLYQRLGVEVAGQTQGVSEYITSPVTDTATTGLPLLAAEDHPELQDNPLPAFPTTLLTLLFPYEGNLTLDAVKMNSSSFPR
ncbi:interleukin-12 receptor subunit beta-2 [Apus apus]|uniref:interleukin-12 receptor subunit beta-2 n=1 Tax=Apus apus TaxID=8895 RepID=UPI0021F83BBA|nr:interleukin-12 receptor subunit beta-2 [Apus apus]XP_051481458.1 interleukin-12 receptor subunit beta-2 [Apus apus]XP_051481459.1 interleukin-12 receptor subunit beta-2 [Apus apus]XP_051481460.1 interleukin-12 receptor subunit beta-2 [Apus apus]